MPEGTITEDVSSRLNRDRTEREQYEEIMERLNRIEGLLLQVVQQEDESP